MTDADVIQLLKDNPNMAKVWVKSRKREIYSRNGSFIIKRTAKPDGTTEKVEITRV